MFSFVKGLFKKKHPQKKYLRITFQNLKSQQPAHLHFKLNDHPFVQKWQKNLKKSRTLPILDSGVFYGKCIMDKESILALMKESVAIVNELAPNSSMRIHMEPHLNVDQKFLDALHKEFERLSVDLSAYGANRRRASDALINLNTSIHQMENFAAGNVGADQLLPYFSFDVNFMGAPIAPLEKKDFDYFTLNRRYGELYLNYNTVGVPVYYAYIHGEEQPPVPQSTYKPDFTVSFNPDFEFNEWDKMSQWLDKTFDLDINDKKLALGYIPLGQCVEVESKEPEELASFVKAHKKVIGVDFVESF